MIANRAIRVAALRAGVFRAQAVPNRAKLACSTVLTAVRTLRKHAGRAGTLSVQAKAEPAGCAFKAQITGGAFIPVTIQVHTGAHELKIEEIAIITTITASISITTVATLSASYTCGSAEVVTQIARATNIFTSRAVTAVLISARDAFSYIIREVVPLAVTTHLHVGNALAAIIQTTCSVLKKGKIIVTLGALSGLSLTFNTFNVAFSTLSFTLQEIP